MSSKDPRDFHASDMRYLLGKAEEDEEAIELLEDFTGEDNVFDVLSILGLNTGLNETNAMSAGAVQGAVGSMSVRSAPGFPKKKKKDKDETTKENVDLSMVDEIMELIIQRGIRT